MSVRKRKYFLLFICLVNGLILLAAAVLPYTGLMKRGKTTTIIGLEHPVSINTIAIQLENGGLDYIHESQENYLAGSMRIYSGSGILRYEGGLERFKGRGNNSWYCPKKGYGITLNRTADLLNLGQARGFVLIPTYRDASLLNFKIAYDLSKEVGTQYAHSADYVELYVNNEYLGVYLLTEQNEINKDRYDLVDLEELTQAMNGEWLWEYPFANEFGMDLGREVETKAYYLIENNPINVTGGYLLELDQDDKVGKSPSRFRTNEGTPIGIRNPAYASKEQVYYISEHFQDFEEALYAEDGYNSKGKYYLDYIDLDSFAKTWLMNELTMDTSILSSQFIWKDSDSVGDGKFHAGCVWDMEHSFVEQNRTVDYLKSQGFWGNLYNHPEFREKVYYVWLEKYIPAIKKLYDEKSLYKAYEINAIDTYVDYISVAADNNFERWSESWIEDVDERGLESWEEEIDYVKRFIAERSAYMTVTLSAYREPYSSMYEENGIYWGIAEGTEERREFIPDDQVKQLAQKMGSLYRES